MATRHNSTATTPHLVQHNTPATTPEDTTTAVAALPGPDRLMYRVADAGRALSLSRSVMFDLIRTGRIRSVKEGRTRLIPAAAIREYISLLEKEAA